MMALLTLVATLANLQRDDFSRHILCKDFLSALL